MTGHLVRRARLAAVLAAGAIAAAVGTASPALASPPDRFSFHIDETFVSSESEGCGFEILLRVEGTFTFMDRYDRDGNLVSSLVTLSLGVLHLQQPGDGRIHQVQQP